MGRWANGLVVLAATAALPVAAAAQYERLTNPPDPRAQLAEQLEIYDTICLRAFPADAAVDRAMTARGATPLTPEQLRTHLHGDPGRGWTLQGRTGRFTVTMEDPPFHACGVRTMTAAGYADMGPYRAVADAFERGGGFRSVPPQSMTVGNVRTSGAGERRTTAAGAESLLVLLTTPDDKGQAAGQTAIEVRFVHQIYTPR